MSKIPEISQIKCSKSSNMNGKRLRLDSLQFHWCSWWHRTINRPLRCCCDTGCSRLVPVILLASLAPAPPSYSSCISEFPFVIWEIMRWDKAGSDKTTMHFCLAPVYWMSHTSAVMEHLHLGSVHLLVFSPFTYGFTKWPWGLNQMIWEHKVTRLNSILSVLQLQQ